MNWRRERRYITCYYTLSIAPCYTGIDLAGYDPRRFFETETFIDTFADCLKFVGLQSL